MEKGPSQIFDRVLNSPLIVAIDYFRKTVGYLFTKFD